MIHHRYENLPAMFNFRKITLPIAAALMCFDGHLHVSWLIDSLMLLCCLHLMPGLQLPLGTAPFALDQILRAMTVFVSSSLWLLLCKILPPQKNKGFDENTCWL